MKKIKCGKNLYAIVDDVDYEELNQYPWHACKNYAVRNSPRDDTGYRRNIYMHRQVMGEPKGMQIDHINMNPLDNRRSNLRVCTLTQNKHNTSKQKKNKSGYKGVCFHKLTKKWQSGISVDGRWRYLGNYADVKEAARVYNEVALKHYGEFARLNEL